MTRGLWTQDGLELTIARNCGFQKLSEFHAYFEARNKILGFPLSDEEQSWRGRIFRDAANGERVELPTLAAIRDPGEEG